MISTHEDVHSEREGLGTLVGGILTDVKDLLNQHLTLFQQEVRQDLTKTKKAVFPIGVGLVLSLVAGVIFSAALALWLHDVVPQLRLWGSFGIVGLLLGAIGLGLILAGKKQFESFNPLPDQTLEAAKENVQWLMKK